MHAWPRVAAARLVRDVAGAAPLQRHLDTGSRRVRLVNDRAEVLTRHQPRAPVLSERREMRASWSFANASPAHARAPWLNGKYGALGHAGAGLRRPSRGIEAIVVRERSRVAVHQLRAGHDDGTGRNRVVAKRCILADETEDILHTQGNNRRTSFRTWSVYTSRGTSSNAGERPPSTLAHSSCSCCSTSGYCEISMMPK